MLNGSKYAMEKSTNAFHREDVNVQYTLRKKNSQVSKSNFITLKGL